MPQPKKDTPDFIDVQNILASLGEEYGVVVYFGIRLRNDHVECTGKTVGSPYTPDAAVQHVALQSFPVKQGKEIPTVLYTLAFDLWLQHDGGGATAAKRGPTRDWRGRLETPRRRKG